ncbi:MAG: diaminopimelate decarboxylase [Bacteroidetes Order II. Incertae sedis bacterium]|nr:diaminopimelate decarboxylase [Bacteroidetes Order II. bacterium]
MKVPFQPKTLRQIASTHGTPTYVYFEETIRDRCRKLKDKVSLLPHKLLYAMKANYNPAILKIICEEGIGIDAVSIGELELAKRVGFAPQDVLYSANSITDEEMHTAASYGSLFNIGELYRLTRFGEAYPGADVCIRLNPRVGAGHHEYVVTAGEKSKFGIPMEHLPQALEIAAKYGLKIIGIHQHIGSGILDIADLWSAVEVLLEAAPNFPDLTFINFGGGLGIPYRIGEASFDYDGFQQVLIPRIKEWSETLPQQLAFWFEPGRYFVAESGILLTEVTMLKQNGIGSRTFAGTNSGQNHLIRPMFYNAYHEIFNLSNPTGILYNYDVTGNICESGDRFAKDRPIQEIRVNDILAILDAGAYGYAMSSLYNLRPFPEEVLVRKTGEVEVVRKRVSPTALIDQLLSETTD